MICFSGCSSPRVENDRTKWILVNSDAANLKVYGLPWFSENRDFVRLPESSKALIEKENQTAWDESHCPSGARVRFVTDSSSIRIRVLHGNERISLYHMASSAVAGMDIYETENGVQNYRGTSKPISGTESYEHLYFENLPKKMREFTLYLPTYAQLQKLEIGVDADAELISPNLYRLTKPVVFYGTSITQSCCASRGSNGFVPLLSRLLNIDVVNLGFSGAGKGEAWMAELVAQIDASAYVIDSVANMGESVNGVSLMRLNYNKFVKIIRSKRPNVPIILMTRTRFADVRMPWGEQVQDTDESYRGLHVPLYETYKEMKSKGDSKLWIFDASQAVPRSPEHLSVDGVHLTDQGFAAVARSLAPLLDKALKGMAPNQ